MGKIYRNEKPVGYDFHNRRNDGNQCAGFGKVIKTITKRKERQREREMCYRALINHDDYEKRFAGE